MIAEAFADIAAGFSAVFDGPYNPSVVRTVSDAATDDGGSITVPGDVLERDCLAQVDAVTEAMRREEGFAERDVRILVLTATLAGDLDTDATVEVLEGPHAGAWSLQTCGRDPMGVYFECRARRP